MRPNKTNFGLSFGDFWRGKREGHKGREEQGEEEEQRYGSYDDFVWNLCMETSFVWNSKDLYGII